MEMFRCSLCDNCLKPVRFNLKTTKSKHSNTTLMTIFKKVISEFTNFDCNICLHCYDLINELDAIELRQKEIHQQIKSYIQLAKIKLLDNNRKEDTENGIPNKVYIDNDISSCNNFASKGTECATIKYLDDCKEDAKYNVSNKQCLGNDVLDYTSNKKSREEVPNEKKNVESTTLIEKQEIDSKCVINNQKLSNKQRGRSKNYPDVAKPHKCHCSKEFPTLWALKNHMTSHSNFKPYICDICGFSYKHRTTFARHMDAHSGISPFTCVYCNKSFTQKVALVRHGLLHTGEKPYQCDKCGKRFVHHTSFKMHRLSHTGQKSHKCDVCGLALMSASHLKRHMRIHTGEKKFICNTCGKHFAERYNLVAHEKVHINHKSVRSASHSYSEPMKKEICIEDNPTCESENNI